MSIDKTTVVTIISTFALIALVYFMPIWFWVGAMAGFLAGVMIIVFYGKPIITILELFNIKYEKEVGNYVDDRINKPKSRRPGK